MTDYELSMPFVLCKTNGGPFDDEAFVIGWDCATLHAELRQCRVMQLTPIGRWVKARLLPQLELIAMDTDFTILHGYAPPGDGTGLDHWAWVEFTRVPCIHEEST